MRTCAACTVYCNSSLTIQRRQCIWLEVALHRLTPAYCAKQSQAMLSCSGDCWMELALQAIQQHSRAPGAKGRRGLELQVLPAAQRPACRTGGPATDSSLRSFPGVPCNVCSTCNACHAPASGTRNCKAVASVEVRAKLWSLLLWITGVGTWHDVDVCTVCKTQTSSRMLAAARDTTGAGIRGSKKAKCSSCAPTAAAHLRRG